MDKLTTLNLTFDRVLIQLIIPGLLACFPYLLLFFEVQPAILAFFLSNGVTLIATLVILLSLISGIILENLGSRIEVHYYDERQLKNDSEYLDVWDKFLQLAYDKEPIGQRYIRNILFRMKFELSVGAALVFMTIGLGIYNYTHTIFTNLWLNILVIYVTPLVGTLYLIFIEGWQSSKILHATRKLLVEKYHK